jgi:DNA-binding transcriptional regulator LsrR (DeoR family)
MGGTPGETGPIDDYKVAQLAWERGMAVGSIVRELKMEGGANAANIMKIKRALERAVRHGILTLSPPPLRDLEIKLCARLTTAGVAMAALHVEQDHWAACYRAARMVDAEIATFLSEEDPRDRLVVANAGGGTVSLICELVHRLVVLPPAKVAGKRLIFVSLNVAEARQRFDEGANFLAVRLARMYGGEHLTVVMGDDAVRDDQWRSAYQDAVKHIDLLITSAGRLPDDHRIPPSFMADWLSRRGLASPERAIGDIAFHFIDARGYPVPPEGEAAKRIQRFIQPQPDWDTLGHLFHTGKVLLVLTGAKVALAQALIVGAHATRCVLDAQLARGMLADG